MAAADFWQFIPTPCDAGSPKGKLPDLPGYYALTFTLMPVGYTSRRFRASTGLCENLPAHPTVMPLSAACSSGQRFAFGFLQIPPRDGHPCRSANTSPCRVCRGLAPPSECALPGAQIETALSEERAAPTAQGNCMNDRRLNHLPIRTQTYPTNPRSQDHSSEHRDSTRPYADWEDCRGCAR